MVLQPVTAADAAVLSKLHADSWRTAYVGMVPQPYLDALSDDHWTQTFTDWLGGDEIHGQIAWMDGVAAGCVLYGNNPGALLPDYLSHWGEIITLYLLEPFWRRGCGSALLQAAVDALRQQGRPGCYLWALRENTRARRFYEARGFAPTEDTIDVPMAGTVLTDYRYILPF